MARQVTMVVVSLVGVLFLVTLGWASIALPDPVAMYMGPATQPDVEYPLLYYVPAMAVWLPLMALLLAQAVRGLLALFDVFDPQSCSRSGRSADGARLVPTLVFAWALSWLTASIWVSIELGNSNHPVRSLLESLFALVAASGAIVVPLGWALNVRRQRRRHARTGGTRPE